MNPRGKKMASSKEEFLQKFDEEYAPKLAEWAGRPARAPTFRQVFVALGGDPLIVETGTTRTPGNWAGDGCSTLLFDLYCQMVDGDLWSVDISKASTEATKPLVSGKTTLFTMDSIEFLKGLANDIVIDLLYLDSLDGNFSNCAEHQLFEYNAARKNLRAGSIVFTDDVFEKGALLIPYLEHVIGAECVTRSAVQSAWRMPKWFTPEDPR